MMNKFLPLLVVVVAIAGGYFFFTSNSDDSGIDLAKRNDTSGQTANPQIIDDEPLDEDDFLDADELEEWDDRPAYQIYESVDDAIAAIDEGAKDYDDLVLEQFTDLGPDCGWCEEFYPRITERMFSEETDEDTKAYLAEVLSISNRPENIQTLINAIMEAGDDEDADVFAEALELSVGDDRVVRLLSDFVEHENELLAESSVAAITNQGSPLAVEILYEHTMKTGDEDGYYSIGIGIGEVIPEKEALPKLEEIALKRDKYAHLGVKALLNYGLEGVEKVFDLLENSTDPEKDRELLVDAIDHVNYEDEIEDFARRQLDTSKNPVARQFAKEILDDFNLTEEELTIDDA